MKEENGAEFRFNNCKHRSEKEESVTVHRCSCQGGNYTETGYKCLMRDIFKINKDICEYCWLFEKK
jgi:hypothetical protein